MRAPAPHVVGCQRCCSSPAWTPVPSVGCAFRLISNNGWSLEISRAACPVRRTQCTLSSPTTLPFPPPPRCRPRFFLRPLACPWVLLAGVARRQPPARASSQGLCSPEQPLPLSARSSHAPRLPAPLPSAAPQPLSPFLSCSFSSAPPPPAPLLRACPSAGAPLASAPFRLYPSCCTLSLCSTAHTARIKLFPAPLRGRPAKFSALNFCALVSGGAWLCWPPAVKQRW